MFLHSQPINHLWNETENKFQKSRCRRSYYSILPTKESKSLGYCGQEVQELLGQAGQPDPKLLGPAGSRA
jgi:hypothetical protein